MPPRIPAAPRRAAVVALVLLAAPLPGAAARAELVVVAHPSVPADGLSATELERIYLGKTSRWSDGTAVAPAMLREGPAQQEFVEDYLARPLHRFVTYWRQMVFTGKGVPPQTFDDQAALLAFVAATPGAVGYARPDAAVADVKVLPLD